jgi:hypothetical protein
MRWLGVIVFSILSFVVLLYAFLVIAKYMANSSGGAPALGFGILAIAIPFAVLIGIPLVFVLFYAVLRSRKK